MIQLYKKNHLWIWFTGTVLMMAVMYYTGKPMKTPTTPLGIIDLEFASSSYEVTQVLSAWKGAGALSSSPSSAARLNTALDFIFLVFYTIFLFTFCRRLSGFFQPGKFIWMTLHIVSNAALAAGMLDVLENIGMLISLTGYTSGIVALSTAICAAIKWFLVLAVIIFTVGILLLRRWLPQRLV